MTASIEHPFRRLGETRKLAGEPADRRVARLREKGDYVGYRPGRCC